MRLPRDLSGRDLAKALLVLGYETSRETGSHIRLSTMLGGRHHVTVPDHKTLPLGRSVPYCAKSHDTWA
ncbi:MAG TPA: type II toxin-antitoxin system HicA family toxin [Bryobacteraceae bacterium]